MHSKCGNARPDPNGAAIASPINMHIDGTTLTADAWTNVRGTGVQTNSADAAHCINWSSTGGGDAAMYGASNKLDEDWTYGSNQDNVCTDIGPVYCFEQ